MVWILNTFLLKYLEKLIYDKYNNFLQCHMLLLWEMSKGLHSSKMPGTLNRIAVFGGLFCWFGFFLPTFFSRGLLQPFSQGKMYTKLNHPFGKLDIIIPQSCGISYGHRHGIYIYICVDICIFSSIWCSVILPVPFQMLHRKVKILCVVDNVQEWCSLLDPVKHSSFLCWCLKSFYILLLLLPGFPIWKCLTAFQSVRTVSSLWTCDFGLSWEFLTDCFSMINYFEFLIVYALSGTQFQFFNYLFVNVIFSMFQIILIAILQTSYF